MKETTPVTWKQKGIIYMILSALPLVTIQVMMCLTGEIPTMEQIFMRGLFILIAACYIIHHNGGSYFEKRRYQVGLSERSVSSFLGLIIPFYTSSHAAQGDATILNKLSPIFVTLLAVVFMKKKMLPIQMPALVLSVLEASIMFRPDFQSNPLPLIMALLPTLTPRVAYTLPGYLEDKVDTMTVITHFSTFSAVSSLPFVIDNFTVPSLSQPPFLILIGVFSSLGQAFTIYAYRYAPTSEISIYNHSGILFNLLFGLVVLGKPVKFISMIKGALIVAASLMVFVYSSRIGKKVQSLYKENRAIMSLMAQWCNTLAFLSVWIKGRIVREGQ